MPPVPPQPDPHTDGLGGNPPDTALDALLDAALAPAEPPADLAAHCLLASRCAAAFDRTPGHTLDHALDDALAPAAPPADLVPAILNRTAEMATASDPTLHALLDASLAPAALDDTQHRALTDRVLQATRDTRSATPATDVEPAPVIARIGPHLPTGRSLAVAAALILAATAGIVALTWPDANANPADGPAVAVAPNPTPVNPVTTNPADDDLDRVADWVAAWAGDWQAGTLAESPTAYQVALIEQTAPGESSDWWASADETLNDALLLDAIAEAEPETWSVF